MIIKYQGELVIEDALFTLKGNWLYSNHKKQYFTHSEMLFLRLLLLNKDHIVSYDDLYDYVYFEKDVDRWPEVATLKMWLHKVRYKIKGTHLTIEMWWGQGLRLTIEPHPRIAIPHTSRA